NHTRPQRADHVLLRRTGKRRRRDDESAPAHVPGTRAQLREHLEPASPRSAEPARPRTRGAAIMIIRGLARRQKAFRPRPSILRARLRRVRKRTALRAAAPV